MILSGLHFVTPLNDAPKDVVSIVKVLPSMPHKGLPLSTFIPRSQGGVTSLENLALACQGCNNHKYNKTKSGDPVTNQLVDLFHPRIQRWREHFTWDERFERIIGLTATGRATVEALQLNRLELINLRRLLYAAGEHPLPATADTLD